MSRDRSRILKMLAKGQITVDEAERLLDAIGAPAGEAEEAAAAAGDAGGKPKPKFLRVLVEEKDGDRVNVRVPLNLIRAGVKLGSLIPDSAAEKVNIALGRKGIGMDLGKLKSNDLDELITQLGELAVDVEDSDGDKVRVFCE